MKNFYQDDSFSGSEQDVFSATSYDMEKDLIRNAPKRPAANPFSGSDNTSSSNTNPSNNEKPVRPVKHAPPPIRKSPQQPQSPPPYYYGNMPPQGSPYYPPYPGYYPPTNGAEDYPVQTYGSPYPPYPPQQMQYPYYPPYPQPPYPPQPSYSQPARSSMQVTDAGNGDAGTRVVYQSPDFDKTDKEASNTYHGYGSFFDEEDDDYETLPETYRDQVSSPSARNIDVSEVDLPAQKRPAAPTPSAPVQAPPSFKIDEMEIGSYELDAMTVKRQAKASAVDSPVQNPPQEEPFHIEDYEGAYSDYYPPEENPYPEDELYPQDETEVAAEKKELPASEIIRRFVLAVSVIAIVIAAGVLLNEYRLHKKNLALRDDMSNLIITDAAETTDSSTTDANETTKPEKPDKATTKPTTTRALTPAEQWQIIKNDNPDVIFPANMQLKYAKLYATNQDFVGYLSAKGSELDTPVVQGKDNDEYIETNFYGESTKYACPFVSYQNKIDNLDMNTVIYGHNMRDGSIFGTLEQYWDIEGYREAPVLTFNTLYSDYKWKIISVFLTNSYAEDDNDYLFNYYWANLSNMEIYSAYLNELSQRSFYDTGVDVLPTDKLLTLSTCETIFDDARLVVVARLVRPGESADVNTDLAVENPNPRYPQAYYDEKGEKNPYTDAYKWYPG